MNHLKSAEVHLLNLINENWNDGIISGVNFSLILLWEAECEDQAVSNNHGSTFFSCSGQETLKGGKGGGTRGKAQIRIIVNSDGDGW